VLEWKITVPALRPGTVSRTALVNRLRTAGSSLVTVSAPAGYGKTTLVSQWAERDSRQFVWVTVDDGDNDPLVLLRHVAAALAQHHPLDGRLLDALRSPGSSIWESAVPRLAAALAGQGAVVLVLDDFSSLRSRGSLKLVTALVHDRREGSVLVAAGRAPPKLPLARLRARGSLVEIGAEELALTRREAHLLLRATGVPLGEAHAKRLVEQCEGWPAALVLAARCVRDQKQAGRPPPRFGGDDRYLTD
jgi:LuxR family maltose regulon positive regulatory protein